MIQGQKDIIRVRIISTAFTTLALAVFKPFGLEVWQWQAYMHLFFLFILGVMVCLLTDFLMKYIVKKPCNMSDSHEDVNYFIRHNLYFQIINTLLVSLMICLYRHFFLSKRVEGNLLSPYAVSKRADEEWAKQYTKRLYWRFKFRSRYLSAELEEVKMMNEQLKALTPTPSPKNEERTITLTGTTSESVTLDISNLLYIEAVGNYVKVCQWRDGKLQSDMLRATSKQIESELQAYPMVVRCHRAFLVNLTQVEQIVSHSGSMQLHIRHSHEFIPVSRSNMSQVKEGLMKNKG